MNFQRFSSMLCVLHYLCEPYVKTRLSSLRVSSSTLSFGLCRMCVTFWWVAKWGPPRRRTNFSMLQSIWRRAAEWSQMRPLFRVFSLQKFSYGLNPRPGSMLISVQNTLVEEFDIGELENLLCPTYHWNKCLGTVVAIIYQMWNNVTKTIFSCEGDICMWLTMFLIKGCLDIIFY